LESVFVKGDANSNLAAVVAVFLVSFVLALGSKAQKPSKWLLVTS